MSARPAREGYRPLRDVDLAAMEEAAWQESSISWNASGAGFLAPRSRVDSVPVSDVGEEEAT